MKILFKTNIHALQKVDEKLRMHQTMTNRQIILGDKNSKALREAREYIDKAIEKLNSIQ